MLYHLTHLSVARSISFQVANVHILGGSISSLVNSPIVDSMSPLSLALLTVPIETRNAFALNQCTQLKAGVLKAGIQVVDDTHSTKLRVVAVTNTQGLPQRIQDDIRLCGP